MRKNVSVPAISAIPSVPSVPSAASPTFTGLKGYIRTSIGGIAQHHPILTCRCARHVAKSRLPKRDGAFEFSGMDDDGTNPQWSTHGCDLPATFASPNVHRPLANAASGRKRSSTVDARGGGPAVVRHSGPIQPARACESHRLRRDRRLPCKFRSLAQTNTWNGPPSEQYTFGLRGSDT